MALSTDITDLLRRWGEGDAEILDQLFPLMYDRMRQLAHQRLRSEPDGSLNTTALAHEAYLLELLFSMPAGREASVPLLRVWPGFDPLRSDPRFEELLARFATTS